MWKQSAKFRKSASGVTKIKRATYNSSDGFSVKNGWWGIRAKVWKRDRGLCVACARRDVITPGKEVHHIIPLSKGGTTAMSNLVTLCLECHTARHNHLYRSR
jgi:5-methylcytosine-specific restriction endonuclease McrA